MQEFPKSYNFSEIEQKRQQIWKEKNIYVWDKSSITKEDNFYIDTPPPTVSGQLHIGHVYSYVQTDFIARFWRMNGKNIFYPIGYDDNGLPTERLVEKKRGVKAYKLDREEFVKICKEVIEEEEQKFEELFNAIGLSLDPALRYQTISSESQKLSQTSFLDLLQKGQIYRAAQPILWDPVDCTALAQADVDEKEKLSIMNDIIFHTENGIELIIATTRPELLPACVCVFYHPEDGRYKHLQDTYAITPIFNKKVPIISDELVKPDKGTGLVMCCTFGDQTDILWWKKHNLPSKIIINKQGLLSNLDTEASFLEGLKVSEGRKKIIEVLKDKNLLKKQTENISSVKCAERSGAPLEILMHDQWFIKTVEHKDSLLQRSNELNWHPKTMKIKLDNWISSIAFDWCISRSRFFGVPFPIWYSKRAGEEGKIIAPNLSELPIDPTKTIPSGYSAHEVEPDLDVMDTWATSSITPMLAIGEFDGVLPFTLRPQAHEIIRTWAFYTMLKAHLHDNCLPWSNIMVSGWCLAEDKAKMSKSKGNVITPHALLESYGADVIRYWAASSKLGADTAYSEDVLKSGKRFLNKLWNAAKFVSVHFAKILDKDKNFLQNLNSKVIYQVDRWLLSKINELINKISNDFENYEYATALSELERFFFADFCDNYLEIVKTRCYDEQNQNKEGSYSAALATYYSFMVILKLLAPFMPFITDEIFSILYAPQSSIHQKNTWPSLFDVEFKYNNKEVSALFEILDLVRKIKSQNNLSIKSPVKILEIENIYLSKDILSDLANVISAENISIVQGLLKANYKIDDNIYELNEFYVKIDCRVVQ